MSSMNYISLLVFVWTSFAVLFRNSTGTSPLSPPQFYQQPVFADPSTTSSNTIIASNSTKTSTLYCKATGNPRPKYSWTKNSQILSSLLLDDGEWMIHDLDQNDSGNYRCRAENSCGVVLSQPLEVHVPHLSQFEPLIQPTRSVRRGEVIILQPPSISSFPTASFSWFVDDVPVTSSRFDNRKYLITDNNLVILDVNENHQYRVEAYNELLKETRTSSSIAVQILEDVAPAARLPLRVIIPPKNVTVKQSDLQAVFECIVNSRPLPDLRLYWRREDGRPLQNDGINFLISSDGHRLTVLKLTPTYEGQYECVAESPGAEFVSSTAYLILSAIPVIVDRPDLETPADLGQSLVIPCVAHGKPAPKTLWYKNAEPLHPAVTPKFKMSDNGSLIISNIVDEDAGIYQCIVQNVDGEDSVSTWLRIRRSTPRSARSLDMNLTVLENQPVLLPCSEANFGHTEQKWYFNGREMSDPNFQVDNSGDLLIAFASRAMSGVYICTFSDSNGSLLNYTVNLIVIERTRISVSPKDTQLIIGSKVLFKCGVTKDAQVNADIQWYQDGRQIFDVPSRRQMLSDGTTSTLEISGARNSDIGVYTCRVFSSGGNDSQSARLAVIELPYAPKVRAELINGTKAINVSWVPDFDGNSAIIRFILEYKQISDTTDPANIMDIGWQLLLSNFSATDRFYIVKDLKPSTSYKFRVSAVNSVGEGSSSEGSPPILLPQTPPTAAPKFGASARNSTAIMIQWQPPTESEWNGVLRGYVIRYKLAGYNDLSWTEVQISQESRRNYILDDLIAWKMYEIQMAAYNDKGVGVWSDSSRVKTLEEAPSASPTEVEAIAISSTSIQSSWLPPDPQQINGVNQGYRVQLWPVHSNFTGKPLKSLEVPPSPFDPMERLTADFNKLEKYRQYYLTVLCFTGAGEGPKSPPVQVITKEDIPGSVKNLHIFNIRDRTMDISWEEPEMPNGVITGYTVECTQLDALTNSSAGMPRKIRLGGEVKKLTVDELQPQTNYIVKVFASTRVGDGEGRMARIQSSVPPTLPCAPANVKITDIDARSAVIQFDPVCDGNTSILQINVDIQTAETPEDRWFRFFEEKTNTTDSFVQLYDLSPYGDYRVRLSLDNAVGRSNFSEPSAWFHTLSDIPSSPPGNFSLRAVNSTAILARWTPILTHQWNGKPGFYRLIYRSLNSTIDNGYRQVLLNDSVGGSAVLASLEEFTTYESQIAAVNSMGISNFSAIVTETTRESVPSAPPVNVVAHAIGSSVILVKWENITAVHQNGVILGYKVFYTTGKIVQTFDTGSPTVLSTNIFNLKKFTDYRIEVAGYTRIGTGAHSPPRIERTLEDVPDRPYNLMFPEVFADHVRITWEPPLHPNGEIISYRVSYKLDGFADEISSSYLPATANSFVAANLEQETTYWFMVSANTSIGWGNMAEVQVRITQARERPERPGKPSISVSKILPRSLSVSWQPGHVDENAPVRYCQIQYAETTSDAWKSVIEKIDGKTTSFVVTDLTPNTSYKFRVQSANDVGLSEWSDESESATTAEDVPDTAPLDFTAIPYTTTSLTLSWRTPSASSLNGRLAGYTVQYHRLPAGVLASTIPYEELTLGLNATSYNLTDLLIETAYEVRLAAFTKAGTGPFTSLLTAYIGEAVPLVKPSALSIDSVSATSISISWMPPAAVLDQRSFLTGFKILYKDMLKDAEHVDFVEPSINRHHLRGLNPFTNYSIAVLVFNSAGDGPKTENVFVETSESVPDPPETASTAYIQLTQLTVTWTPPVHLNGILRNYEIRYSSDISEKLRKEYAKICGPNETSVVITGLQEMTPYSFSVRASTVIGYGNATVINATTGPQPGSPSKPTNLVVNLSETAVNLHWHGADSGKAPVEGYLIQARRNDAIIWDTVDTAKNGPADHHELSYLNLVPSTRYAFRILAMNRLGVSEPSEVSAQVQTPNWNSVVGLAPKKPFWLEVWFLILVAATGSVIIILLIACLCIKSKAAKYRQEVEKVTSTADILQFPEDDEFAAPTALELRQSMRRSARKANHAHMNLYSSAATTSLRRKNVLARGAPFAITAPPMGIVPSIAYSDVSDVSDLYPPHTNRGFVNDDSPRRPTTATSQVSSSLTEKPSEMLNESSTDEVDDDSMENVQREEPDEQTSSFVNHYANLNNTLRRPFADSVGTSQSARSHVIAPQAPYRRNTATSVSASIADSDTTSVCQSLTGGLLINNKPGNRNPLPGFSSFV